MSDAATLVTYPQASTGYGPFQCSRRTAAHLDSTKKRLAREHPGCQLVIIQGCYHTGLGVSEGTHDKDACLDVRIVGMTFAAAQTFLRRCGWAAWWRRTWQGPWSEHIHMVSLGFAPYGIKVGIYVDGGISQFGEQRTSSQVDDYFNHSWGLEGMHDPGADPSWFPPDINATIFDFEEWERELEDDMGYSTWTPAEKKAFWEDGKQIVKDSLREIRTDFFQGAGDLITGTGPDGKKGWKLMGLLSRVYNRQGSTPATNKREK